MQSNLNAHDIFAIPVGEHWQTDSKIYLLYAPLSSHISLADRDSIEKLDACCAGTISDRQLQDNLNVLTRNLKIPFLNTRKDPDFLHQLDILVNYTCNFHCVYCYSAAGRSSQSIRFEDIKAALDYLFCSGKQQERPYVIHFSGGGEPLMNFNLIKQAVEYVHAVGKNYKYELGVVTNASLLTNEIVDFFIANQVDIAVSFEVLKELQDKERGSYGKVAANIQMLIEKKAKFGIRTTLTHEGVKRMCDIIRELNRKYPSLRTIVFDTVLSPDLFKTPESLNEYYKDFLHEYFKAKKLGEQMGIEVSSLAVETRRVLRDRTCEGKLVLTPSGTLSACSRISSPSEKLYKQFTYGKIENGKISFDKDKFGSIMTESTIYSQDICKNCFAKWNCGGNCHLFHLSFGKKFLQVKCDFTREALKQELLLFLFDKYHQKTGMDLHEYIAEKLKEGVI